ncbi:hypothetical protein AVEN_179594-1 [Araneus ventricosus]|uniref:Uncharacterized protein n=1 Tax=Araneus ventricosus TaxID=182803 RepID=A0A4Y2BDI2_ARAVE|nr:hypothetical protein AVEN_179594-1 [Araneus ventricosus]
MSSVLQCVVSHTITNHYSSFQNPIMPFGPVNPIDFPYGTFVFNYSLPRKPLFSVAFGHNARASGQLNGSKDRCEVNHVSLRENGMNFLPCIPIQLTGNPLGSELGGIQWH